MKRETICTEKNNYNFLYSNYTLRLLPIVSILMYIFFTLFNTSRYGAGLYWVILPIILFFIGILTSNQIFIFRINHIISILFWFFAVISTIFSHVEVVKSKLITLLIFCIFFITATAIKSNSKIVKNIITVYVLTSVLASTNIIWNMINSNEYGWKRYSLIIKGINKDPNYVSAFIIAAIVIIVYKLTLCKEVSNKKRYLYYLSIIIMLMGCLATGSRAAFITFLTVCILIIFQYMIKMRISISKLIAGLIGTFLLVYVFINILPAEVFERVLGFSNYTEMASGGSRLITWSTSLQLFIERPILGTGIESLYEYLASRGLGNSHNIYIDILCGQGLIGMSLFFIMIIDFILVKKQDILFMISIVVAFFLPLFFINGFNTATFWTPMIICQILSNYSRQSQQGLKEIFNNL